MTTIPLSQITATDRQRQDLGDLDSDFNNVRELGLIQPIVLEQRGSSYHLIAGGRRLAWLLANGFLELYHGTTCDPLRPGYILSSELTELQRQEAELYENIKRKSLHWKEETRAIAKCHRMHWINNKASALAWSQLHTAKMLNLEGSAKVTYSIQIAEELENPESGIHKCENFYKAMQFVIGKTEALARAEQQRRRDLVQVVEEPRTEPSETEPDLFPGTAPEPQDPDGTVVWLSRMAFLGEFKDLAEDELAPGVFSCAVLYGEVDGEVLTLTLRSLKEHSYLIWVNWHPIPNLKYYEVLWNVLGLQPDPALPFLNSITSVAVFVKGFPEPVCPSATNVVSANRDHYFHLPPPVLHFILKAITKPGDQVLLPTAGPLTPLLEMGLRVCTFDPIEGRHKADVDIIKEHYDQHFSGKVVFK